MWIVRHLVICAPYCRSIAASWPISVFRRVMWEITRSHLHVALHCRWSAVKCRFSDFLTLKSPFKPNYANTLVISSESCTLWSSLHICQIHCDLDLPSRFASTKYSTVLITIICSLYLYLFSMSAYPKLQWGSQKIKS